MAGYSLWATEEARIDIVHYDCRNIPVSEAGRTLAQEVEKREHVAGVLLFSAGMEREIDAFLIAMAGGDERCRFPVIGAQAAAASHPCICGSFVDGFLEEKGIVALILSGPNLQMFYNYEMGWRPIGKEMRVTETRGKYCISKINGMPAASIYWKYLGVEPDEYFAENVREFPFVVKRGDREVVRTPSGTDEEGNLQFIARIKPDESLHLSYGNPRRLMDEVHLFANSMARFKPQALLLIECENRIRFLGNMSEQDIVCYWSIMPQVFWVRGYTAIMMDRQGGGVVNSSILSVGFREGMRQNEDPDPVTLVSNLNKKGGAIPLDQRLAMFLEQTTHELAEMAVTAEAANTAKSAFLSARPSMPSSA